jgi:hypothetical protein
VSFVVLCRVFSMNEPEARQLRLRIGRLRRRVDRRLRAADDERRRLTSWRTYAVRYPGSAVAVAFGVGLALALGLSGRRWLRWIAMGTMQQGLRGVGKGVADELLKAWTGFGWPGADKEAGDV